MAGAPQNKLPKPEMRNLHAGTIKRNLIVGSIITVAVGVAMYYYNEGRKKDYAEFYK